MTAVIHIVRNAHAVQKEKKFFQLVGYRLAFCLNIVVSVNHKRFTWLNSHVGEDILRPQIAQSTSINSSSSSS